MGLDPMILDFFLSEFLFAVEVSDLAIFCGRRSKT